MLLECVHKEVIALKTGLTRQGLQLHSECILTFRALPFGMQRDASKQTLPDAA